jgi:hypothetical protein
MFNVIVGAGNADPRNDNATDHVFEIVGYQQFIANLLGGDAFDDIDWKFVQIGKFRTIVHL